MCKREDKLECLNFITFKRKMFLFLTSGINICGSQTRFVSCVVSRNTKTFHPHIHVQCSVFIPKNQTQRVSPSQCLPWWGMNGGKAPLILKRDTIVTRNTTIFCPHIHVQCSIFITKDRTQRVSPSQCVPWWGMNGGKAPPILKSHTIVTRNTTTFC